ncbi:MAG: tRNA (adenosine(37)-N6)-threonylcarbamoyltransferase complex transferase subunit TsaD, partial [Pseudomonadota bacterium]
FSFSGLKTAVRETVEDMGPLLEQDVADICASFEAAVAETMEDRLARATETFRELHPAVTEPVLVAAGGVAANSALRRVFVQLASARRFKLMVPPPELCMDNAAMIAWAGAERLALGLVDDLDTAARPRWPLDQASPPVYGSGKLGAKA